jgi:hypothetical protein
VRSQTCPPRSRQAASRSRRPAPTAPARVRPPVPRPLKVRRWTGGARERISPHAGSSRVGRARTLAGPSLFLLGRMRAPADSPGRCRRHATENHDVRPRRQRVRSVQGRRAAARPRPCRPTPRGGFRLVDRTEPPPHPHVRVPRLRHGPRFRQPDRGRRRTAGSPSRYLPHLGQGPRRYMDAQDRRPDRERLHPGREDRQAGGLNRLSAGARMRPRRKCARGHGSPRCCFIALTSCSSSSPFCWSIRFSAGGHRTSGCWPRATSSTPCGTGGSSGCSCYPPS